MTEQEQLGAVEAILFASGDPVSPDKIADALEISVRKAEVLLETVSKQSLSENSINDNAV